MCVQVARENRPGSSCVFRSPVKIDHCKFEGKSPMKIDRVSVWVGRP
jgi:hypothetical protein